MGKRNFLMRKLLTCISMTRLITDTLMYRIMNLYIHIVRNTFIVILINMSILTVPIMISNIFKVT